MNHISEIIHLGIYNRRKQRVIDILYLYIYNIYRIPIYIYSIYITMYIIYTYIYDIYILLVYDVDYPTVH